VLRDFQAEGEDLIFQAWDEPNVYNVMPVFPTGAGKTVLVGSVIKRKNVPTCAIAHRQELVSQMSLALNRENIWHGIIAPKTIQQQIIRLHHETHGYSRYKYNADVRVAGVDTLPNHDTKDRWLGQVGLVVQDEGHHVLKVNKWGRAMGMFPNARGLFPTAHALRADGNGLGRLASGLVDRLVLGPSCRELITRGFLTDYDIYCPESDLDFSEVEISPTTGEFIQPQLRAATHKSKQLVGNVVDEYLKRAPGKLGVTFAVDIEEAKKIAAEYNARDVPAEIITAKTPVNVRGQLMAQFRRRVLLQLVSVDCLGEGVDVPAIEVISMARRTASFQLFAQQLGRTLRPMLEGINYLGRPAWDQWGELTDLQRIQLIGVSNKTKAIIIDHVGNTVYMAQYHGRPCSRQNYTLDDAPTRSKIRKNPEALRTCTKCAKPYERYLLQCPYCQHIPPIPGRILPEQVEGDIVLLDPNVLAAMQLDIDKLDGPPPEVFDGPIGGAILKNHYNRQRHQASLRHIMTMWGGWRVQCFNEDLRVAQKRFYLTFGVDVMSAQALAAAEATVLEMKIIDELNCNNVTWPAPPVPLPPEVPAHVS
jgi:superfamily II DNA or RNA helicase